MDILQFIFELSLVAAQSQNPRRSDTAPVVLLNRRNQIKPKSERNFAHLIL